MTDPIMSRFADIGVPGRRKPANRDQPPKPKAPEWDDKPVRYIVKGVEREFFTIRHVAMALGRSVQSIRAWENQGVLPKSPYRSPKPRKETVPGVAVKGRRLWTREQIMGMIRIAQEMGVIFDKPGGGRGKPPSKAYALKVNEMFRQELTQHQS